MSELPPDMAPERTDVVVREAVEDDVEPIRDIFASAYGEEYPYQHFYDPWWLKRSVFTDDILMLVAVDAASGEVLGTGSVVFDVGAHSDLTGEFGRLAVSPAARGRGVGKLIMAKRVDFIRERLHVGIVENRTAHRYSQQISHAHGFAPVGFLPLKHKFTERESIALFVRHFGNAIALRCNHPRVVPEAHALAHMALDNCGLPDDAIVDEDAAPYPRGSDELELEDLTARGLPALIRIERGRVRNREVFGPVGLQHGFFKLSRRQATYLVAHQPGAKRAVAGAIGYTRDDVEQSLRVFELIARSDEVVPVLFEALIERCRCEWGLAYVEVDVSAHAPRLQRTLVELGFLPAAYVPAMVFHQVERLDVIKFVRLLCPPALGDVQLTPASQLICDQVMRGFTRQAVLPRLAQAIDRLSLFRGLSDEQAARVACACTVQEHAAGSRLFAEGVHAEGMQIVIDGRLRIDVEGTAVGAVGAGESVGEVALLTGEPHSASATAEGPVVVAHLGRAGLRELTRQRPDVGVVLYRNLALGLGRKLQRVDASLASDPPLPEA